MKGAFCEAVAPCQDFCSFVPLRIPLRQHCRGALPSRARFSQHSVRAHLWTILIAGALWSATDGWRHMSNGSRRATSPFPALTRHCHSEPARASRTLTGYVSSGGLEMTGCRAGARHHLWVESSTISPQRIQDATQPPRQCYGRDALTSAARDALRPLP